MKQQLDLEPLADALAVLSKQDRFAASVATVRKALILDLLRDRQKELIDRAVAVLLDGQADIALAASDLDRTSAMLRAHLFTLTPTPELISRDVYLKWSAAVSAFEKWARVHVGLDPSPEPT